MVFRFTGLLMKQQNLEQRVRYLEDAAAIRELKYRYFNACDEKQPELVTACFAPGEIDINFGHIGVFNCREDFVEVYKRLGCHENIVDMHHAQNPIIRIDEPNAATAKIALRFYSLDTRAKTSTGIGGFYNDEYRRIDNEWLIVRSHFKVNSVELRDFSSDKNVVTYIGNAMPGQ